MHESDLIELPAIAPDKLRPLRFDEYMRLAEAGVFDDEKVELLAGVVVAMNAQGDTHVDIVVQLTRLLARRLPDDLRVAPQCTFRLSEYSGPEPDFAIITKKALQLHERFPADTWLIEVAVTSLHKDLGLKAQLYAIAGIAEYWVIDANTMTVKVHVDPTPDGYRTITRHDHNACLAARIAPSLGFTLAELLDDLA